MGAEGGKASFLLFLVTVLRTAPTSLPQVPLTEPAALCRPAPQPSPAQQGG